MIKEPVKEVIKVWGKERWLVNCDEYCGKLLYLNKNAQSSLHKHFKKKETFFCLSGQVALHINGRDYMLNPYSRAKTIYPGWVHQFRGITDAVMIEVSTHHEDNDIERITESKAYPQTYIRKSET